MAYYMADIRLLIGQSSIGGGQTELSASILQDYVERLSGHLLTKPRDTELSEDEYTDHSDGLIHCKKCEGRRQTILPDL